MIKGRLKRAQNHGIRCHFDGPGHKQLIPAGRGYYEIREGEAQGVYHGPQCYDAALKKYKAIKEQSNVRPISSEDEYGDIPGIDDQY